MKKLEMFTIAVLIILSNTVTIFITKQYLIPDVKTVSLMEIINDEDDANLKAFTDGKISEEEYTKKIENKMARLQESLDFYSNGKTILLIEEAVIKTKNNNYTSITEQIKNYVKKD